MVKRLLNIIMYFAAAILFGVVIWVGYFEPNHARRAISEHQRIEAENLRQQLADERRLRNAQNILPTTNRQAP